MTFVRTVQIEANHIFPNSISNGKWELNFAVIIAIKLEDTGENVYFKLKKGSHTHESSFLAVTYIIGRACKFISVLFCTTYGELNARGTFNTWL